MKIVQPEQYIVDYFENNPNSYRDIQRELDRFLIGIKCAPAGSEKPFPINLQPVFLASKVVADVFNKIEIILSALVKIRKEYFQNRELQKYIDLPEDEERIILYDTQAENVGLVRADAFLQPDGKLKIVEYNTDFPDGYFTDVKMLHFYRSLPHIRKISNIPEYSNLEELFFKSLMYSFRRNNLQERPVFGSFAPPDRWWLAEFYNGYKAMREKGYEAYILNPKRLDFHLGKLVHNGRRINIVRRCSEMPYFVKHREKLKPFFESYKNGDFILYNSFKDRILGHKALFAVLTDGRWQHLFTEGEKRTIKKCIPWTRCFREGEIDFNFLQANKNKLVLKPAGGAEGRGVIIGSVVSSAEWNEKIQEVVKFANDGQKWIVQEKIHINKRELLKPKNSKFHRIKVNFDLMFHLFTCGSERMRGPMYSRSSTSSVVNMAQGGALHPIFEVE